MDISNFSNETRIFTYFNGEPETDVIISGSVESFSVKLFAGQDCSMYMSKRLLRDNAQEAIKAGITRDELVQDLLTDFTITEV